MISNLSVLDTSLAAVVSFEAARRSSKKLQFAYTL